MAGIGNEIWQAARRLLRAPVFTLAAALTLALAIGANATIFAVVQRVVLNPLPYPESDRLVRLDHGMARINVLSGIGMTSGLYYQYQRARTLEGLAIYRAGESTLVGRGEPERIQVARTTPTLASVLRVPPARGRWFTAEEGTPGAPLVAILSHGLWMRRFGGDAAVLGTSVTLDGVPATVIGIMPASFAFPEPRTDAWLPAVISRATGYGLPYGYVGVGRLRGGATVADARTELNTLIADLPQVYPGDRGVLGNVAGNGALQSTAITLKEAMVGDISRGLWILLAAVGLVLLVACANVANLFLVRSEARQREVAVRRALGASSGGIARFFLTESVLLSIAGGAIGLVLASGAVSLLVTWGPATLPRLEEIRLDTVAIVFTFALSLLAALAFGSIPLLRGSPLAGSLNEVGRGNTASRGRPSHAPSADGRTGCAGARAAGRLGFDGPQLPEPACVRSRLRCQVGAHVARWIARTRLSHQGRGGRRALRDPRSARRHSGRHRRLGLDGAAAGRRLFRQRDLGTGPRRRRRQAAPACQTVRGVRRTRSGAGSAAAARSRRRAGRCRAGSA